MSLTNWRDLWDERWRGLFPHFCHYSPEKNNRLKRVRDLNVWDDPTFAEPRFLIVPIIMWSTFTLMKRHCRSPVLGQWNYCFLTHNLDDPLLYVSLFYVIKMNSLSLSFFSAKMKEKAKNWQKNKAKETKMELIWRNQIFHFQNFGKLWLPLESFTAPVWPFHCFLWRWKLFKFII